MPYVPIDTVRAPAAAAAPAEPDARGQAALLLAESILHALVEGGILTAAEAVAVVRTASEVKVEVALDTGKSHGRMVESLNLLAAIGKSFEADGG